LQKSPTKETYILFDIDPCQYPLCVCACLCVCVRVCVCVVYVLCCVCVVLWYVVRSNVCVCVLCMCCVVYVLCCGMLCGLMCRKVYGVASLSRIDKFFGLFCKRAG